MIYSKIKRRDLYVYPRRHFLKDTATYDKFIPGGICYFVEEKVVQAVLQIDSSAAHGQDRSDKNSVANSLSAEKLHKKSLNFDKAFSISRKMLATTCTKNRFYRLLWSTFLKEGKIWPLIISLYLAITRKEKRFGYFYINHWFRLLLHLVLVFNLMRQVEHFFGAFKPQKTFSGHIDNYCATYKHFIPGTMR